MTASPRCRMGLLADLQSMSPADRRQYAEDCLLVLDRNPTARLCYPKDALLALEAMADRPKPLRYADGDLDVGRMSTSCVGCRSLPPSLPSPPLASTTAS
jgi:hypothetical protein